MSEAYRVTSEGLKVAVRATPRGGRDAVEGVERLADGRAVLRVRVRAAAADGAANDALRRCLAATLGCAPSAVVLSSGATSRFKLLEVRGDPLVLADRMAALCTKVSAA